MLHAGSRDTLQPSAILHTISSLYNSCFFFFFCRGTKRKFGDRKVLLFTHCVYFTNLQKEEKKNLFSASVFCLWDFAILNAEITDRTFNHRSNESDWWDAGLWCFTYVGQISANMSEGNLSSGNRQNNNSSNPFNEQDQTAFKTGCQEMHEQWNVKISLLRSHLDNCLHIWL